MTTLDFIRDVHIYQHKSGYRFSVDALLVDAFVKLPRARRIADLCAGSGVIGLLLAKRYRSAQVTLVEIQESLVKLAEKNSALNNLDDRVSVVHADIGELVRPKTAEGTEAPNHAETAPDAEEHAADDSPPPEATPAQAWWSSIIAEPCFDLVVANPPFRPLKSGRLSIGGEKAIARHEIALSLNELVSAAARMLRHHGRFCFIQLPERLADICVALRHNGCEAKRVRFVHSRIATEAKMVLVEAVRGGKPGLEVEKPLILYDEKGNRTEELLSFYAPDYQPLDV